LPFSSVRFRLVPGFGAESRQPDGNANPWLHRGVLQVEGAFSARGPPCRCPARRRSGSAPMGLIGQSIERATSGSPSPRPMACRAPRVSASNAAPAHPEPLPRRIN
jgi:hypothetical protein